MMYIDFAIPEKMPVFFVKPLNHSHQILCSEFSTIGLAFNLGYIEYPIDIIGQSVCILNHIRDILELIFPGKFIFAKCLEVQL